MDSKSRSKVRDVLASKHPPIVVLTVDMLEEYDTMPELVTLDITLDVRVSRTLRSGCSSNLPLDANVW